MSTSTLQHFAGCASLMAAGIAYRWWKLYYPMRLEGKRNVKTFGSYLPEVDVCCRTEVLRQDQGIDDTAINQEPENVTVEFSCLTTDQRVILELVCLLHTSHKLIVSNNIGRTRNLLDSAIMFYSVHCGLPSGWLMVDMTYTSFLSYHTLTTRSLLSRDMDSPLFKSSGYGDAYTTTCTTTYTTTCTCTDRSSQ